MMRTLVTLALICGTSAMAVGQVLPSGPVVITAANDLVIGRVVELEQYVPMVIRAEAAIITMEVDGENGIAVAYPNNLTHSSMYVASDCTGPPLFDPAMLGSTSAYLQFRQTPFFITDASGLALYRIDPTQPPVTRNGAYIWQTSTQSCGFVGGTFDFHEGQLVDANFGSQYPPPYRLAVEPASSTTVASASVPAVGAGGLFCLVVLLAWFGIQRIRMG